MSDQKDFADWMSSMMRLKNVMAAAINQGQGVSYTHAEGDTFTDSDLTEIKEEMRRNGIVSVIAVVEGDVSVISVGTEDAK